MAGKPQRKVFVRICGASGLQSPPTSRRLPSHVQGKAGGGGEQKEEAPLPNHTAALEVVSKFLGASFQGVRPCATY